MPLPAALAARLAKRGIIKEGDLRHEEEVEEVFAEDYDVEDELVTTSRHEPQTLEPMNQEEERDDGTFVYERLACPNRANQYHTCSDFCRNKYGKKSFVHDRSCEKKRERMLRRYPPPEGWQEVGDPDTGRYYYWNVLTDQVSWLPPQHPRAKIVFSDADIKSKLEALRAAQRMPPHMQQPEEEEDDLDDLDDLEDPELLLERELEKRASGRHDRDRGDRDRGDRDRGDRRRGAGRGRRRDRDDDELDPMDPASYSDIPRGTWSSGLELKGSAKTGADVTASGPLFQQRPYPAPGAVLRANREMEKK